MNIHHHARTPCGKIIISHVVPHEPVPEVESRQQIAFYLHNSVIHDKKLGGERPIARKQAFCRIYEEVFKRQQQRDHGWNRM
jgi:hypothetical protein